MRFVIGTLRFICLPRTPLLRADNRGWTPLHCALKRPSSKSMVDGFFAALNVEELCDADLKRVLLHQTCDRWTPLHQAAASSCSLLVVQALVAEIRHLGDDVLLKNLNMKSRQGHLPSRPSNQVGAAEINTFLASVRAEADASMSLQPGVPSSTAPQPPPPFF